jgi:steroid delta-isomerase-like uncharacterized protein
MPTAPSTNNKLALTRFCAAVNTGDMELIAKTIDEVVEPDALIRTPLPIEATGAEKLKEVFGKLHRAFPDLRIAVEDLIEQGDKVVSRNTVTGTHLGEYMGLPPTGKPVAYNEIFIARVRDGRIAETWGVVDVLSQLRQLGAIPDLPGHVAGARPRVPGRVVEVPENGVVSVRYMVDDVEGAIEFYTTNFGFELDWDARPAFAAVTRGNLRLLLAGPESSAGRPMPDGCKPGPGGWNRIHFVVDDIAAEMERLRGAGVHFRNELLTGLGGRQVLLDDPSGNPIELFQPTAAR